MKREKTMEENKQVSVFGNMDIMDTDTLRRQMAETADIGGRGNDGVSYMSFSGKKGKYTIGVDDRAPGEDEPFLVAIPLFKIGWICWKGGKPIAKRLAGLRDPQIAEPAADEMGPFDTSRGEGWMRCRTFAARSMENGEEIEFSSSSKSGVSSISDLHKQVRDQMASSEAVWPAITFSSEEFEAGGYKNEKPTFEVVKWLTREEIMQWTGDFDPMSLLDDMPAPEPVKRVRRQL